MRRAVRRWVALRSAREGFQNVMTGLGLGFAARCEAEALPRRRYAFFSWPRLTFKLAHSNSGVSAVCDLVDRFEVSAKNRSTKFTRTSRIRSVTITIIILVVFLRGAGVLAIVNARRPPVTSREAAWSHVTKSVAGAWERSKICGHYQGRPVEIFVSDHGHKLTLYFYHLRFRVRVTKCE